MKYTKDSSRQIFYKYNDNTTEFHKIIKDNKLLFQSDNTVNYRGFSIDYIEVLYPSCAKGDLDLSGLFDVIDIITLVNVILGVEVDFEGNIDCRADLNNDGISNVIDIVSLVELILNN